MIEQQWYSIACQYSSYSLCELEAVVFKAFLMRSTEHNMVMLKEKKASLLFNATLICTIYESAK